MSEMLWYKETAAVELADNTKRNWDAEQWGWYMLLKLACWNNDPKAKLKNEEQHLRDMAKANPKSRNFAQRWAQVLACFNVEDEFIVHPKLILELKDQKTTSKEKSRAGRIGQIMRQLNELPKKDPRRAALQAEFDKLKGTDSEDADPSSTIPKPAPSKSDLIEYDGKKYFPSQLGKILKDAEAQQEKLKKQKGELTDHRSASSLNITNNLRTLGENIGKIKAALGYTVLTTPPPEAKQKTLPLAEKPAPRTLDEIEGLLGVTRMRIEAHLLTPEKLDEAMAKCEDLFKHLHNPPAEARGHYFERDDKTFRPHIQEKMNRLQAEMQALTIQRRNISHVATKSKSTRRQRSIKPATATAA